VGCARCRDTGYAGRQGIYEVLANSREVQEHIRAELNTVQIRKIAMSQGMRTLRLSGASRVARGETTIEEVMRVAPQIDA
jgi:general secretion pathway protein E